MSAATRDSRDGVRPASQGTRLALVAQGVYYVVTGAWPLVSLSTFEAMTGPKTDDWLVRTVGVLAVVIGVTLLAGARHAPGVVILLAVAAAAGFTAIDVVYASSGVISPIYLGDAAVEAVLAAAVLVSRRSSP